MKNRISENRKVTLTIGQLRRLVRESIQNDENFEIEDGVLIEYRGQGGDVVIPNGVMKIGNYAFEDCVVIKSVTIPNSVTSIGERAFRGCDNLTSITIGNGVTSIGDRAFDFCGFMSVTIPDSVTRIGWGVFGNCDNLKTIYVANEDQEKMLYDSDLRPSIEVVVK